MTSRICSVMLLVLGLTFGATLPALGHPHVVDQDGNGVWTDTNGNGQWDPGEEPQLAGGQLHGAFSNGVSCGGDPAAYGLETAHHGPDAGTPGKGRDGCYRTTGGVAPGSDVANPVIR